MQAKQGIRYFYLHLHFVIQKGCKTLNYVFFIYKQIMQVIAVRYLHTAYRSGLHVGNQITCKAYLLRSLTDTEPPKNPVRKKVFKKRKFRQARTLHWVSVSYRRGKKRYVTSSASDVNSSDELLKPIYE